MRSLPTAMAVLPLLLALSACSFAAVENPPGRDTTTLHRFDGEPLRRRDIAARRAGALALSRSLMLVERELREPWAEDRSAAVLIEHAAQQADMQVARELWRMAEPVPPGLRRDLFCEAGFYGDSSLSRRFTPPITPPDFESAVARMLSEHNDRSEQALLLAAWRRFSPELINRRDNYLASHWRFECSGASLLVAESLLGPHNRSRVEMTGSAFLGGPSTVVEGYRAPEGVLALVAPGPASPVQAAIDALAASGSVGRSVQVEGGSLRIDLSEDDRIFLHAALKGLKEGCCESASLPLGCTRLEVTFDYLVGNAEARATMRFTLKGTSWVLDKLVYEPAAAAVMGREGASLDLIALLREDKPALNRKR